ncbi:MAG TPA: hypothetical protein VK796_02525 [Cytophaga sp.]|nr:hypothetical protein [Cytophaga sp.]
MNKIHLAIISSINLILVSLMIRAAWQGNDKAILAIVLLYPILTFLNAVIWFVLFVYQQKVSKLYKWSTIGMIVLFIPALAIASMY